MTTLDGHTRHRRKTHKTKDNTTQKTRKMSNADPTKILGINPGARER
jgi:hypothetical protein